MKAWHINFIILILILNMPATAIAQVDTIYGKSCCSNDSAFINSILDDGISEDYDSHNLNKILSYIVETNTYYGFFNRPRTRYSVKIFYLPDRYTMLYLNDGYNDMFFRIYGYKENDFIHFYNRVLLYYLRKKDIKEFLHNWCLQDSIFSTIDFNELIKSVRTRNRRYPSMISTRLERGSNYKRPWIISENSNIFYRDQCLIEENYAYFSNRIYYGCLPPKRKTILFR